MWLKHSRVKKNYNCAEQYISSLQSITRALEPCNKSVICDLITFFCCTYVTVLELITIIKDAIMQ